MVKLSFYENFFCSAHVNIVKEKFLNPEYKLLMNFFVIILRDVNTLNNNLEKQTNQNSMHV